MNPKELSIIIVTFKSDGKISDCLDSIPNNIEVIIVENSNNQKFKKDIENKYENVRCILVGSNKGYAIANNIGLNKVQTKYGLVLNPDTNLSRDAIDNFFSTANKYPDFWLIGPAKGQQVDIDNKTEDIIAVKNLKGFAIFLNILKFDKNFFDENFFLYFEEIDLCKRVIENRGKIYLDKNINIKHEGASSVEKTNKIELEKNRNWHWMWSMFYFNKKYKGFFLALLIILPKLISSAFKTFFYLLTFNKNKRDIYYCRLSGITNSITGKNSWYRPSLD